ncbi:MAG: hypothetical protein GVY18_00360 [Bacteroidetes bacterium]|jgi:ESS family glutamate:Na+ symporter|nr:hypothetical protein [Bacteroidota bacterium]
MSVWEHSFTIGQFVLDFVIISTLFVAATICRRYVHFFQRFLIPNSLIAGFLGLLFGPELLHLMDFSLERMGAYVYHLLALTFIGVGLYGGRRPRSAGAIGFGFIQILSFLVQVLIGLSIALGIVYLIDPDFIPAVGTLLPLGFGMGPGIAYSIGQSWEAYGLAGGGTVGLTIAAFGFLVSYFTGIMIVHRGIRRGQATLVSSEEGLSDDVRTGLIRAKEPAVGARLTFFSGAIEPLTFHLALIGGVYLMTYALLSALSVGLVQVGLEREVVTLWSFNFVFANLLALGVRRVMTAREIGYLLDEGLLNRATGLFADYLIATSIMAISLSVAYTYLWPLLAMCSIGAAATYFLVKWASERTFVDFHFERFVGIYGEMTGTISSGLALVRVTDPEYQTPVAQDLVLGSGVALVLGFPLLLLINLPFSVFSGQLEGYWVVLGCSVLYLSLILWLWSRIGVRLRNVTPL